MFSAFRRLTAAIDELGRAVDRLAEAQEQAAPAIKRLEALEVSRFQFEAEVSGTLLEVKGKLRAALNSEARERQLKRSYEANVDEVDEAGDPGSGKSPILPNDVEAGEAERVSALRLDVAPNHKAAALAHKFRR